MDVFDILAAVGTMASAIFAAYALVQTKKAADKSLIRERKEATIKAVNLMQNEVFDEMLKYKASDVKKASEDTSSADYKMFSTYLARCDHFAIGIEESIYDYAVLKKLAGGFIWPLYQKFVPLIEKKRAIAHNNTLYKSLEGLAEKLKSEK